MAQKLSFSLENPNKSLDFSVLSLIKLELNKLFDGLLIQRRCDVASIYFK